MRALEVLARDIGLAAERRRPQRIQNPEVAVNRAVLVGLVERERALEHRLDPRQLGDCGPVLARRVEIARAS